MLSNDLEIIISTEKLDRPDATEKECSKTRVTGNVNTDATATGDELHIGVKSTDSL